MFFGTSGSPTKSNTQKRVREPTGSSGPDNDNGGGNGSNNRTGAGMALWRPDALPPPPRGVAADDAAVHGFTGGFPSDFFALESSSATGEGNAVRLGRQVPQRPYTAFPFPTAPLFAQQTPEGAASVPQASLSADGGDGSCHVKSRAEQSFNSFPVVQQQQQGQGQANGLQASPHQPSSIALSDSNTQVLHSLFVGAPAGQAGGATPVASAIIGVPQHHHSNNNDSDQSSISSAASACSALPENSSSAASSSSDDDESDTNENSERGIREDRIKRYPRFTREYATKCKGELVPFVRELFVSVPNPLSHHQHQDPANSVCSLAAQQQQQQQQKFTSRFVLYGKYVYQRTLGKGTYSKVVLAEELDHSPAVQQRQLVCGGSNGSRPAAKRSNSLSSMGSALGGTGGPQVALKIFRDSEVYREACWEEYNILSALCNPVLSGSANYPVPPSPGSSCPQLLTTVRTAPSHTGLMDYYGNVGRFMTPTDYIPHPLHPAVVYPVMGPSLLHVVRSIKKASKDLCAAARRASSPSSRGAHPAEDESASREDGSHHQHQQLHGRHLTWFRGLPHPFLKAALYQVLLFLKFTHERGLVHTDLKPENILFETDIALPAPVKVFYKCLERGDGGAHGEVVHADSPSLETRKIINDVHKLTSAGSKGNRMTTPFPSVPSGNNIAWKLPPGAPPQQQAGESAGPVLHHAHTVTVRMPLLNSIRVVDLGAAQFISSFTHKSHIDGATPVSYDPIQTSHYRSPETLMGTGWNASADIFSLGCMIPELLTGDCLFMPQDTQEHLALMRHIIGPFWAPSNSNSNSGGSSPTIERVFSINARTFNHYFDPETNELKWPVTEEIFKDYERQLAGNEENGDDDNAEQEPPLDPFKLTTEEDEAFVYDKPTLQELLGDHPLLLDLCQRMLRYNPLERISAAEALCHPFFHSSS